MSILKNSRASTAYIIIGVLFVLLIPLFGLLGSIFGSLLMVFCINKILINTRLTKNIKIAYGVLFVIAGILLAFITSVIIGIILHNSINHSSQYTSVPAISTTILQNASSSTSTSTISVYSNQELGISVLSYPTDWSPVNANNEITFVSPDKQRIVDCTQYQLQGAGKTLTDWENLVENPPTQQGSNSMTNIQIKNLNGNNWLLSDIPSKYTKVALYVTGKYNNTQYYQCVLNSNESSYAVDSNVFNSIIGSIKFQ